MRFRARESFPRLETSPGPPYQLIHRHGIGFGLTKVFTRLDVVGFLAIFLLSLLANDILFESERDSCSPQVSVGVSQILHCESGWIEAAQFSFLF